VQRLRDMSPLWEMVQEGVDIKSIQVRASRSRVRKESNRSSFRPSFDSGPNTRHSLDHS
jgi:hypothetical protein